MADSDLGLAVLRVQADTTLARQALNDLRQQISSGFGKTPTQIFADLKQGAQQAGTEAGTTLRNSFTAAINSGGGLKLPDFRADSIRGALDISRELRATIQDLRAYKAVLEDVRETASATDPSFKRLTSTLAETRSAIKAFENGSGDLIEALARVKNVSAGLDFRPQIAAVQTYSRGLADLARNAVTATTSLARVTAKGGLEALKVPFTGPPRGITDTVDKARAQIERLQKQAETTSGKVARLTEGIFTLGAGGAAAKGLVDVLGNIASNAQETSSQVQAVAQGLNSLPGGIGRIAGLGDAFAAGSDSIRELAANLIQAQSQIANFTGPLQGVTEALTALGPEAAAFGGAFAFAVAGVQDLLVRVLTPGIEDARKAIGGMTDEAQRLLEALANVSEASQGIASLRDLELARPEIVDRVANAPVGSQANLQATRELLALDNRISQEKQRQATLQQRLLLTDQQRATIAQNIQRATQAPNVRALPSTDLLTARTTASGGAFPRRLSPSVINETLDNEVANLAAQVKESQNLARAQNNNIKAQSDLNGQLEQTLRLFRALVNATDIAASDDRILKRFRENEAGRRDILDRLRASDQVVANRFRDNEIARGREIGRLNVVAVDGELPGGGFAPGSPRDRAQRAERRRDAASNALIGGAFPLLFGQGIGASLGGGIGGGLGGFVGGQFGFGLSLVGTAVGAQVDRNFANLATAGRALDAPVKRFSELAQAGLISSRSVERNVEALIATGREAEAAAAIQRDLATTLGDLDAARALANSTDDLNRAWNQLGTTLVAFTAGPLAALLNSINRPLQGLQGFFQDNFATRYEPGQAGLRATSLRADVAGFLANPLGTLFGAPRLSRSLGLRPRQAEQPPTPEQLDGSNAIRVRRDLLALTRQQNRAEAQGNDALATSLSLEISRRKERGALLNLSRTRRQGPEGDEIRQAGITEREQIVESALATANLSERELQNAKELNGVYGSQRDILERQQRLRTANRDLAQAEAAFARGRTGPDSAALQAQVTAARNARDRLALDNAEQDRLARIDVALGDQQSRNRIADTQDRAALDRRRLGLSPERLQAEQARLDAISAQREARLAADAADARPGDEALVRAAREAAAVSDAANQRAITAAQEYYRIITDAWRDVELQIASTDDNIAVQRQRRNLTGTGVGIFQERANLADRRRQTLELFRRAGRDPQNERLQIEAVKAADGLRLASETFKANLIEAFQTAQRQALDLRRTLEDSNLAQSELQTDREKGLNKFLRGTRETEGLFENQRQGVNRLLPQFEQARERAAAFFLNQGNNDAARQIREAANNIRDRGSRLPFDQQGALYRDFINRVNTETRLEEDVQQVQRDLLRVNNDLAVITKAATESTTSLTGSIGELTKNVVKLTDKNWEVEVNVLPSQPL